MSDTVLLIHGGAGAIQRGEASAEREAQIRLALDASLKAGWAVLGLGGAALDAVEAAVRVMEDSACFNAGHGAALTSEGTIEHDAAIMNGATRAAGALSGSRRIRNPVSAARAIMERTPHVHLTGDGLELFARREGLPLAPEWYFFTPERLAALERVQAGKTGKAVVTEKDRHGTVGAVARDKAGHLAAATSTGGYADKMVGRVGDTPIIGAGTYADDATIAFSGTGHGESFMKLVLGHRVACLVELGGMALADAGAKALAELGAMGATGGFIAVDGAGRAILPFNSPGMYRGIARDGVFASAIFGDETLPL